MTTKLVSKKHIDIIVTAFDKFKAELDFIFGSNRNKNLNLVGQILWEENYKSFTSIYPKNHQVPKYSFAEYSVNRWRVLKAIEALDFHSSESLSYKNKSEAKIILDELKKLVIYRIAISSPKYRKAEWLIEDYDVF
jgi:hypothetical protein